MVLEVKGMDIWVSSFGGTPLVRTAAKAVRAAEAACIPRAAGGSDRPNDGRQQGREWRGAENGGEATFSSYSGMRCNLQERIEIERG